jgi:hypothetical protein
MKMSSLVASTGLAGVVLTAALGCVSLSGCSTSSSLEYQQKLASIPTPTTQADRMKTCAWLRAERDLQERNSEVADTDLSGLKAWAAKSEAHNNAMAVQAKSQDFGCSTLFSDLATPPTLQSDPAKK